MIDRYVQVEEIILLLVRSMAVEMAFKNLGFLGFLKTLKVQILVFRLIFTTEN